eukprot:568932-Prorocentrum_minimum.AAC.5
MASAVGRLVGSSAIMVSTRSTSSGRKCALDSLILCMDFASSCSPAPHTDALKIELRSVVVLSRLFL